MGKSISVQLFQSGEDANITLLPLSLHPSLVDHRNYAVSGHAKACDVVAEIAKPEFKARMTVKLAVAGAFHTGKCIFMQ